MKNFILMILLAMFCVGCASKQAGEQIHLSTSSPIFFDIKPQNRSIFIDIRNSSGTNEDVAGAVSKALYAKGYTMSPKASQASIVVKGDMNYFVRNDVKDKNVFMDFGFGMGSGGYRGSGVGIGMVFDGDDYRTNSYYYLAQVALNLTVKDGKTVQSKSTNLDLKAAKNNNSASTMINLFGEKIADKIDSYLNF